MEVVIASNPKAHRLDQVEARLVVLELDLARVYPFLLVYLLLHRKHVVVEYRLELLVRVVDAELLKRVHLKDLKPKDLERVYTLVQRDQKKSG